MPPRLSSKTASCPGIIAIALFLALTIVAGAPGAGSAASLSAAATVAGDAINVRSGPGTAYGVLGQAKAGQVFDITGKSADGKWWQVAFKGKPGWVYGQLVQTSGELGGLPVVKVASPPAKAAGKAPASGNSAARSTGFDYGVQAHMVDNDQAGKVMEMTRGLGFNWVKQQVEWKRFEPSPGAIDWGALDNIVGAANATGVRLLFSVVNSPDWARPAGFDPNVGGPPADPNSFAHFLGQLAGRYCGTPLSAIEVWNEQNLHYEWGNQDINPAAYMALLKPSYAAIKRACPSMTVVSGALTPTGASKPWGMDDYAYFEGMYRNGLKSVSDAIGAHPSGFNVPPSSGWQQACTVIQSTGNSFNGACDNPHHSWSFRSTLEGYYNIMRKYGDSGKKLWPTEFGWAAGGAFDTRYKYADDNSLDEQAAWTVEAYKMMKKWGWVGPAFLWNLNFRVVANGTEKAQWGIVDPGWGPLPAYGALRDMSK
jgi:hypothetical protein